MELFSPCTEKYDFSVLSFLVGKIDRFTTKLKNRKNTYNFAVGIKSIRKYVLKKHIFEYFGFMNISRFCFSNTFYGQTSNTNQNSILDQFSGFQKVLSANCKQSHFSVGSIYKLSYSKMH